MLALTSPLRYTFCTGVTPPSTYNWRFSCLLI
nr:MAG TPA: hypothetical protein [Caudoviricetes sp.]